jgi:predicted transcriptional regulator of viral defense system
MAAQIDIVALRERITEEEFDYQTLMHALREYVHPRNRVTTLLQRGDIIRVKKGLYVFGQRLRRRPVSRELLSNLINGPSYVSREYALRFHGFIPEQVHTITAMTTGRSRSFHTPLGAFTYTSIPLSAYPVGIVRESAEGRSFFLAAPEKALADQVYAHRNLQLRSVADVERYLLDDLRIEAADLQTLNPSLLRSIRASASSKRVQFLMNYLLRLLEEIADE